MGGGSINNLIQFKLYLLDYFDNIKLEKIQEAKDEKEV